MRSRPAVGTGSAIALVTRVGPLDRDPREDSVEPRGSHQLRSPSSSIVAGTSTILTRVASMRMAAARPRPNILAKTSSPRTKDRNTVTMTAAPAVMTRADLASPSATASALSPVLSYSSLIRESRKTS